MQTKIKVDGMSCNHCVAHVTKALEGLPGVKDVKVSLEAGDASFEKPDAVSMDEVKKAVEEEGYQVGG